MKIDGVTLKSAPSLFCVLCECKNAGNMGAIARAIKNMGLEGLILVRPNRERWLEAIKMAPGAEEVLEKAEMCSSMEHAISGMHYVIGTTSRIRKHRLHTFTPREIIPKLINLPSDHRIAIVFGSERTGLSNHQLSFCQKVIVIPSSQNLPSINLAQAVMILAYEWHMSLSSKKVIKGGRKMVLAGADKRKRLMDHTESVLNRIGFIRENTDHIMLSLIDMLSRLDLSEREVAILRGILSRIEYCLDMQKQNDFGLSRNGM
ncbi:MAG: RNA methyltransferase [bacterium]